MKKVFLSVAVAALVAVGFTSCKKAECIQCSQDSGYDGKFCEEDWNSSQMNGMSWKQWSDLMASSPYCEKVSK